MERLFIQQEFVPFDAVKIQDVIRQPFHVSSSVQDRLQIVLLLARQIGVHEQPAHAGNGIEGGAQVVRDLGDEGGFSLILLANTFELRPISYTHQDGFRTVVHDGRDAFLHRHLRTVMSNVMPVKHCRSMFVQKVSYDATGTTVLLQCVRRDLPQRHALKLVPGITEQFARCFVPIKDNVVQALNEEPFAGLLEQCAIKSLLLPE